MERRRRLGNRLTRTAHQLLAHRLDHLPLARHALKGLGNCLAKLRQHPATARACGWARDDDALTWQMCWQRAAHRFATHETLDGAARLVGIGLSGNRLFGDIGRKLFELQFRLFEQFAATLG